MFLINSNKNSLPRTGLLALKILQQHPSHKSMHSLNEIQRSRKQNGRSLGLCGAHGPSLLFLFSWALLATFSCIISDNLFECSEMVSNISVKKTKGEKESLCVWCVLIKRETEKNRDKKYIHLHKTAIIIGKIMNMVIDDSVLCNTYW